MKDKEVTRPAGPAASPAPAAHRHTRFAGRIKKAALLTAATLLAADIAWRHDLFGLLTFRIAFIPGQTPTALFLADFLALFVLLAWIGTRPDAWQDKTSARFPAHTQHEQKKGHQF